MSAVRAPAHILQEAHRQPCDQCRIRCTSTSSGLHTPAVHVSVFVSLCLCLCFCCLCHCHHLLHYHCLFLSHFSVKKMEKSKKSQKKNQEKQQTNEKNQKKRNKNIKKKNQKNEKMKKKIKERKSGLQGVPTPRDGSKNILRNVTRNRAAIEAQKIRNKNKKNKTLNPEGRTPSFKRLTCFLLCVDRHTSIKWRQPYS